jgi:hypothetical protein
LKEKSYATPIVSFDLWAMQARKLVIREKIGGLAQKKDKAGLTKRGVRGNHGPLLKGDGN